MINFNKHIKIAIIGSGIMGTGIAQVAAMAGHEVVIYDKNEEALEKSKNSLFSIFMKLAERGKIENSDAHTLLSKIKLTNSLNDFAKSGLIIEAIVENLEIKQHLFSQLDEIVSHNCFLATNTSSLPIASIAKGSKNPERVIGLHFFNPAPLMPLVEIVPAITTNPVLIEVCKELMIEWGKIPIIVKDTPGFVVNKITRPFYGESLRIYEEGIADFVTIDHAMKTNGGFKMGPFEVMDLIGNDNNYKVTEAIFNQYYYDSRFKPSITQKRYVEAGWNGRKSGKGFYEYEEHISKIQPNNDMNLHKTIFERVIDMLINEAVDTLMYNIASVNDIELAMKKGVNYPKGLLQWADEIGLAVIVNSIDNLYNIYREDRYRTCPLLRKYAEEGKRFID
jgi:3-hydroxybutyryl-CoA dehydrogenase